MTAALLKSEGYDVVGITPAALRPWRGHRPQGRRLRRPRYSRRRNVAERIGIRIDVLDYESRFREIVIDNFADSYALGETPVPCIECNRSIKFRDRWRPRANSARVRSRPGIMSPRAASPMDRARWLRAADADRDQSYFLFATTREQLDYLRFPLGDMTKPQARELARRFGLEVADKQDSQDICFVPTGRYTDIIGLSEARRDRARRHSSTSKAVPSAGIRASFISRSASARGSALPPALLLYVVKLDAASRRVVVGCARRCGWIASGFVTSTGSATARSTA